MPVYEYICKACDHEFEREQRISDNPLKKCPKCGAMKAKRLISRTSFVLKGGGWYETDFKGKDKRNAAKTDNGAKSDAKADAGAKSTPAADKKAD